MADVASSHLREATAWWTVNATLACKLRVHIS